MTRRVGRDGKSKLLCEAREVFLVPKPDREKRRFGCVWGDGGNRGDLLTSSVVTRGCNFDGDPVFPSVTFWAISFRVGLVSTGGVAPRRISGQALFKRGCGPVRAGGGER